MTMANDYTVYIVTPPNYPHVLAFAELANALVQGLGALGFVAGLTQDPAEISGRAIVLAPHLIPHVGWQPPADAILYNLEQGDDGNDWFSPAYWSLLRSHEVWDYSAVNAAYLAARGVPARLLPVGYAPCLSRIEPAVEDIDVLAYGAMTPRRIAILQALHQRGLKVVPLFNVYGPERDRYIARSRLVLNIHAQTARLFEIVRVSYLLANGRCVLSEDGNDAGLEAPYRDGVEFVPYDGLIGAALALLADGEARRQRAEAGRRAIMARPQSGFLEALLGRRQHDAKIAE